ncbi:MAG TPA: CocE/NonD family hydrolase [Acidobacteriota bacterium]|nr:CocE/NonD family hydrolase [Acidobacteriota bacterium]
MKIRPILILAALIFLQCTSLFSADQTSEVEIKWAVKIPVRDGVKLNATLYLPKPQAEPVPVIFTFTPYISDSYHPRAYYFAKHGYGFALIDVRGRGNSEGEFEPFKNEGRDGHDVVEWIAKQSWCNGKVTMWGGSYAGFDQWTVLKEFPAHLSTIVPAAAAHAAVDFPFFKNIFYSYDIQWLTFTSGVASNQNLFGESSLWIQHFREMYLKHRPFRELDQIVGNTTSHFQTWLKHPTPDEYWDAMVPTEKDYQKISVPILTITGHYDGDQAGALEYYKRHMKFGNADAIAKHYLIMGPWDHAGTRTPQTEFGGLKFDEASKLDMNKLHTEWYDWTMKTGKKPEFLKDRIAYYVIGAEKWKYVKNLDEIAKDKKVFYLNSDGSANDVFESGTLSEAKANSSNPDEYVYDPLDVRPAEIEKEESESPYTDQRIALNLFGNGLVYHTEPFAEAFEFTGFLKFVAWISMDVPDTDFQVTVFEILPDGKSILLSQDMIRARYRDSLREAKLVKYGEINRYEFNAFTFMSRQIGKGSRLRLLITSPNTIHLQKNYNSGGDVSSETAKDARTAHIKLYHDAEHPSHLEVPVVK